MKQLALLSLAFNCYSSEILLTYAVPCKEAPSTNEASLNAVNHMRAILDTMPPAFKGPMTTKINSQSWNGLSDDPQQTIKNLKAVFTSFGDEEQKKMQRETIDDNLVLLYRVNHTSTTLYAPVVSNKYAESRTLVLEWFPSPYTASQQPQKLIEVENNVCAFFVNRLGVYHNEEGYDFHHWYSFFTAIVINDQAHNTNKIKTNIFAISPCGKFYLLAIGKDAYLKKIDSYASEATFFEASEPLTAVAVGKEGTIFATASNDLNVRIYTYEKDHYVWKTLHTNKALISKIKIVGNTVYLAGNDGTMWVYKSDGTKIAQFKAHEGAIHSLSVGKNILVTSGLDRSIKLWNISDDYEEVYSVQNLPGHSTGSISADDTNLFVSTEGQTSYIKNLRDQSKVTFYDKHSNGKGIMTSDGKTIMLVEVDTQDIERTPIKCTLDWPNKLTPWQLFCFFIAQQYRSPAVKAELETIQDKNVRNTILS